MATKKIPERRRYAVLRDVAVPGVEDGEQGTIALAGETVDLDDHTAALLIRDGMIREEA